MCAGVLAPLQGSEPMSEEEKIERTPANENPWYWLATVYGEPSQVIGPKYHDLCNRNRNTWNRWVTETLSGEEKAALVSDGVPAHDLIPLSEAEREQLLKDFIARAGDPLATPPYALGDIDFSNVHFEREVVFSGFVFPTRTKFSHSAFFAGARFSGAVFYDYVVFEHASFKKIVQFDAAKLLKTAHFASASFSEFVSFMMTNFLGDVVFSDADFSEGVDFSYAQFLKTSTFTAARFSRFATFFQTKFHGHSLFRGANFSGGAIFDGASFLSAAIFDDAFFTNKADFVSAQFKGRTSFASSEFFECVPDLRDAKLREANEWHQVGWSLPPTEKAQAQQQVYAYEKLKAEMERLKKHADEQFFFARELRARRALEPFLSLKWLLYFGYEQFSGYGQSVVRPLVWLALFWAAGAGLFALLPAASGWPLDYDDAARLSLVNLVPFLPYKPGEAVMKHLDDWVEWFGIFQAIVGAALLFLFGLALRNLFRMK